MAERKYITDLNLQRFGSNVRKAIKDSETTLNTEIGKAKDAAQAAASAAAGALKEAQAKIPKGGLKTINGQGLEGSGNLSLADIGIDGEIAKIVAELPKAADALSNKIYLIKSAASATDNTYAEYIKVVESGTAKWEKIGEWKGYISVDSELSDTSINPVQNKVVKAGITTAVNELTSQLTYKVDKVTGKGLSTNDYTTQEKKDLADLKSGKANNTLYKLPDAADGVTGGIQIGYASSGKDYAVKLLNKKAYVTVGWTDQNVSQAALPASYSSEIALLGSTETQGGKTTGAAYIDLVKVTPATKTMTVGKATTGAEGIVIAKTFKGTLDGNAGTATRATTAGSADSATKATQDGNGKNIASTYQTKTDFNAFKNEFVDLTNTEIDNLWDTAPDTLPK